MIGRVRNSLNSLINLVSIVIYILPSVLPFGNNALVYLLAGILLSTSGIILCYWTTLHNTKP